MISEGLSYKVINPSNISTNSIAENDSIIMEMDNYFLFQGYIVFTRTNLLMISSIENIPVNLLTCEFTEELIGVYFDSHNYLLLVVLRQGKVLMVSPKFNPSSNTSNKQKGYCESKSNLYYILLVYITL